jgi:peptide/nickel transport system ATP-binding protein
LELEEYLRQGCKFAGRCPEATENCKGVAPTDIYFGDVMVKCHKYSDKQVY